MKTINVSPITPQDKIISTNNLFGNKNIKKQQGSTVIIYDTLPLDGNQYFEFFRNAKNRAFPQTNLTQGTLQPGESFALERAYLVLVTQALIPGPITDMRELALGADAPILAGEFQFQIENQRVIKPMPLTSWIASFNKSAQFTTDTTFEFDTQLTIPPLLEINAIIRTNDYDPANYVGGSLRLVLEGAGGIFSPRNNY